ncbi:uncharacterized protein LOC100255728 isoform X2 [Vitis vinifera]|uniref:uncharacterized protein LOC100255728 isoform X2 n=1 Tax=Vitis vinifera TaxID=29760 RepID=UPI0008FFA7C3|nr:uncharacterized protein LOC100255728 isoform X2 [Vitis vinifera]|eukprot:XP_019074780.1 PREDICTED: uncharacterized protein LOC100255728 [Vitis vinifera]
MAACAACRYAGKIGTVSGMGTALYKFKAFSVEGKSNTTSVSSPFGYCRRSDYRPFSQFVKSSGGRLFPVDTLAQIEMTQESNLSKFKSEVESSQFHVRYFDSVSTNNNAGTSFFSLAT